MRHITKAALLVAAFGLAACNNPDRFGAGGAGDGSGGFGTGSVGTTGLGDPNDPKSLAYFQQRVGDRVHFAVDQHTLSNDARGILAGQAQWLNANPHYAIIMEGHADEQGTRDYNLALGARRASAAQEYLISQGVSPGRIRTISYGKERPIAEGSNEDAWARNRNAHTMVGA